MRSFSVASALILCQKKANKHTTQNQKCQTSKRNFLSPRYSKEKYSRDDEAPHPWEWARLSSPPSEKQQGFYPASEFGVNAKLREAPTTLSFPP